MEECGLERLRVINGSALFLEALRYGAHVTLVGELGRVRIEGPDPLHRVDLRGIVRQDHAHDVVRHFRGGEQLE